MKSTLLTDIGLRILGYERDEIRRFVCIFIGQSIVSTDSVDIVHCEDTISVYTYSSLSESHGYV